MSRGRARAAWPLALRALACGIPSALPAQRPTAGDPHRVALTAALDATVLPDVPSTRCGRGIHGGAPGWGMSAGALVRPRGRLVLQGDAHPS